MTNALKGAAVAAVTGASIAALIVFMTIERHEHIEELCVRCGWLALIALAAAIPVGAALGVIAGKLRDQRLVVLEIVAVALVPLVGVAIFTAFGACPELLDRHNADMFLTLVVVAATPVAISTIVLERWTRPAIASPRF
jgi:predicted permease